MAVSARRLSVHIRLNLREYSIIERSPSDPTVCPFDIFLAPALKTPRGSTVGESVKAVARGARSAPPNEDRGNDFRSSREWGIRDSVGRSTAHPESKRRRSERSLEL